MPGAFPQSASPPARRTPSAAPKESVMIPVQFDESTPKQTTTSIPSHDEMHPAQHHPSTAKPLDEARWLGFADMARHTEPPKQTSRIATLQGTPTREPRTQSDITSPQYKFTFQREHSLELSPEAKKLMLEKREEAARIREQMTAAGEGYYDVETAVARKIAMPKGKSGRFSQAHLDQFQKMDSIAGHASAFRTNSAWQKPTPAQQQPQPAILQSTAKSLKRNPSKAQLDEPDRAPAVTLSRSPSKPTVFAGGSSLPRVTSQKNLHEAAESHQTSPAKRVKRFQGDDATITRPSSSESDVRQPATPSPVKQQPSYPDLTSLDSPTQASLARAASIKSMKTSKIPAPALARSPSKPSLVQDRNEGSAPSTPLLARSPSKTAIASRAQKADVVVGKSSNKTSPLLIRSPLKAPMFKKQESVVEKEIGPKEVPLLSRSPLKMSVIQNEGTKSNSDAEPESLPKQPLLSRSPMKISVSKPTEEMEENDQDRGPAVKRTALFSRSPLKMSVTRVPDLVGVQQASADVLPDPQPASLSTSQAPVPTAATPTKPSNKTLMDRFSFLRSSPMKSILRSPQRLYSDDPAKVASGTHLATPPKKSAAEMNRRLAAVSKTVPNRKHVDFSSSTKARYERAQSETTSTPSQESTPASAEKDSARAVTQPSYRTLPTDPADLTITPQKRRQTIAPGDFTFRAGPDGIVFGTSPNAPASLAGKKRPSTIRHVSAEPTLPASTTQKRKFEFENDQAKHVKVNMPVLPTETTSKKRKFEFENDAVVADNEDVHEAAMSDKENTGGQLDEEIDGRPAKTIKQSAPTPEKKVKRPTLGVKPKGEVKGARSASGAKGAGTVAAKSAAGTGKEKKSATISQARLAALAQPKRRG